MYRLFVLICCIYFVIVSSERDVRRFRKPRIIGGEVVPIEEAPYQVTVLKLSNGYYEKHMCGGSIIAKNYVLTAAHCALLRHDQYRIRSGTDTWYDGEYHEVVDIRIHKEYRMDSAHTANHDVAIMKVSPGFKLDGRTEKVVELANEDDEVQDGEDAFVTGWGRTSPGDYGGSEYLRGIHLKIMDFQKCSEKHNRNTTMTEHCICAAHPSNDRGTCKGDSGGPLIVRGKQVGIVSWSAPTCAASGLPGVYADVAKYRHWIDERIRY